MYAVDASDNKDSKEAGSPKEGSIVDMAGVEDSYHEDSSDIIHHGESSKEYLQTDWDTLTEHSEHTERKSDIRSHRDSRTLSIVGAMPEQEEYADRYDHTSNGCNNREQGLAERR